MFKVTYNTKDINKDSKRYGVLTPRERKFESLQDAFKYVRELKTVNSTKYQLLGMPTIERL